MGLETLLRFLPKLWLFSFDVRRSWNYTVCLTSVLLSWSYDNLVIMVCLLTWLFVCVCVLWVIRCCLWAAAGTQISGSFQEAGWSQRKSQVELQWERSTKRWPVNPLNSSIKSVIAIKCPVHSWTQATCCQNHLPQFKYHFGASQHHVSLFIAACKHDWNVEI